MRKTKIICTIGPASESEEKLRELMLAGMNVARFNFSHGSHKEQLVKYNRVLKVRKELGLPVATLLDTKGPEIRLRDFEGGKVELVSGQQFILTTEEIMGTAQKATISYKNLKNDIKVGTTIQNAVSSAEAEKAEAVALSEALKVDEEAKLAETKAVLEQLEEEVAAKKAQVASLGLDAQGIVQKAKLNKEIKELEPQIETLKAEVERLSK